MLFRDWLEAKLDPIKLSKRNYGSSDSKNYISHVLNFKLDKSGHVTALTDDDYKTYPIKPHVEILPLDKQVRLQRLSPQSIEFRKIIESLKTKYHDIGSWNVDHFFQAGHLQAAGVRNRTVDYWLKQQTVSLADKMPDFYHGTCTNLWYNSINKKGLMPRRLSGSTGSYGAQNIDALSKPDVVYLSTHPDAATRSAARQAAVKHGGQPLILKISGKGLFAEKMIPDEDTKTRTAQDSVNIASSLGYNGRIPVSLITPFLLGTERQEKNRLFAGWGKFKDVPVEEHPWTKKLKNGQAPYYGDSEYYAFKDAGILGNETTRDERGFPHDRTVIKRIPGDKEVQELLNNSGWTTNVREILSDLNKGYGGVLYQLKGKQVPKDKNKVLDMLLDSKLVSVDRDELNVDTWNPQDKVIKLAKLMGKTTFQELKKAIEDI